MASITVISSTGISPYQFGAALAAHGDRLLVGSPYRYFGAREEEGIPPPVAALFTRSDGRWTLTQPLSAREPSNSEGFGRSVLLLDALAAVGAPGHENGDGPVEVFARDAGGLRPRAELLAPRHRRDYEVLAEYGVALAAEGTTLVVGAPLEVGGQDRPAPDKICGAVFVFDLGVAGVPLRATLHGARALEDYGVAVALSGDLMVVGAAGSYSSEQFPGAVYVLSRDSSGGWHEVCRLSGEEAGEMFGAAVAIEGTRIAVAAPGRPHLGNAAGGRLDLFELTGSQCTRTGTFRDKPGFGHSVALLGERLAVGQPMRDGPDGAAQAGRVGLFSVQSGGTVGLLDWLAAPRSGEYARLGSAVALGPDYVAAGAPGLGEDDDGAGFVVTYPF